MKKIIVAASFTFVALTAQADEPRWAASYDPVSPIAIEANEVPYNILMNTILDGTEVTGVIPAPPLDGPMGCYYDEATGVLTLNPVTATKYIEKDGQKQGWQFVMAAQFQRLKPTVKNRYLFRALPETIYQYVNTAQSADDYDPVEDAFVVSQNAAENPNKGYYCDIHPTPGGDGMELEMYPVTVYFKNGATRNYWVKMKLISGPMEIPVLKLSFAKQI